MVLRRFLAGLLAFVLAVAAPIQSADAFGIGRAGAGLAHGGALGGVQPPLRQVSTNTFFPGATFAGHTQINSASPHYARSAITSLQVVYANAYGLNETSIGAATITVSVEYPTSTFTQFKFKGVPTGSVTGGELITSDVLSIAIPNGAKFNIRSFFQAAGGIIYYALPFADAQFFAESAASGLTDKTMGGSLANGVNFLPPVAIIARTRSPAACVIGDSIPYGTYTAPVGVGKDIGIFNAALGPSIPIMNLAAAGETASGLYAKYVLRRQLLQYATGFVIDEGNNDIQTGASTAAQLITDLQTIAQWSELAGKKKYLSTLFPKSTTSTNWLTRPPQTPWPTEAQRVAANGLIRPGVTGYTAVLEYADVFEGGRDLGTWTVDGSGNALPQDGTHLTANGAIFGAAAGILTAAMFQ